MPSERSTVTGVLCVCVCDQPLPQVVHYDQYREPVLEYEDDK